MKYFLVCLLVVPLIKSMEPADSSSDQPDAPKRTSSSLKLKFDLSDADDSKNKGILGLYPLSPKRLDETEMKVESYEMLKGVSPTRATEADIFKIHSALAKLKPDQKAIILELLKDLKGTTKIPTIKERLKEFPWIIPDDGDTRIYRFLRAAYKARGYPRTNEVLESCMTTLSSFHTSASPTPTFMSTAPASQFTYPERTEATIQQIQQNQQMQSQMMQQLSTQLWTLVLKQTVEKNAADDKSAADGFSLKDLIDPKKIIKNSLVVGLVALLSVGNSAVSYFLGGQSSCE